MSELRREEDQRERIPTKVHAIALGGALGFLRGAGVTRPRFRRLAGSTCRFPASAGPVTSVSTSRDASDSSGLRREALGRILQGCRIGSDLGGSDRKVAAVIDGAVVFSEEIPWSPYFQSDPRAREIFETVGTSLGYAIAHYVDFYEIRNLLLLGRVTSGEGGGILIARAREVLEGEFPSLAERIAFHIPSEKDKRHGQAIAAAGLPVLK